MRLLAVSGSGRHKPCSGQGRQVGRDDAETARSCGPIRPRGTSPIRGRQSRQGAAVGSKLGHEAIARDSRKNESRATCAKGRRTPILVRKAKCANSSLLFGSQTNVP